MYVFVSLSLSASACLCLPVFLSSWCLSVSVYLYVSFCLCLLYVCLRPSLSANISIFLFACLSLIDSVSVRLQCLFVPLSFSLTGYLLFSIYLPLSVFVCLSVSLSVFQSVCLSFSVCMPVIFCMSDCHVLSLCLSLSASLYLSASDCPGIFVRLFVSVCFCLSNCLIKVLYIFLSFCPSVFCLSVYVFICLSVCLPVPISRPCFTFKRSSMSMFIIDRNPENGMEESPPLSLFKNQCNSIVGLFSSSSDNTLRNIVEIALHKHAQLYQLFYYISLLVSSQTVSSIVCIEVVVSNEQWNWAKWAVKRILSPE